MRFCRPKAEVPTLNLQIASKGTSAASQNALFRECGCFQRRVRKVPSLFTACLLLKGLKHTSLLLLSSVPKFTKQWTVYLNPSLTSLYAASCQSWRKGINWPQVNCPRPLLSNYLKYLWFLRGNNTLVRWLNWLPLSYTEGGLSCTGPLFSISNGLCQRRPRKDSRGNKIQLSLEMLT